MFGKHNLVKDGAQTEGVILETHSTHTIERRVVIAVKFDDGETAEFSENMVDYYEPPSHSLKDLAGNLAGDNVIPIYLNVGTRIPVRYDPSDRKRIAVDLPALHEHALQDWTRSRQASRAKALASLDTPAPSRAQPLDPELQALMDAEENERKLS